MDAFATSPTSALIKAVNCIAHVTPMAGEDSSENRRASNYKPSTWDYEFLQSLATSHNTVQEKHMKMAEKLKEEVKSMIKGQMEPVAKLELINILQRLGLKYRFESEIKEELFSLYKDGTDAWWVDNLHATALRFRLLRENGIFVPQEVFETLKDKSGKFKSQLCKDVRGLLSLYEASYLGWEGEDLLDEAKKFSTTNLNNVKESISSNTLGRLVKHALNLPLHWSAARYEARWFIDEYEKEENVNPNLLKYAKFDFNIVQSIHQRELGNLARWWVETGLDKLSFVRNTLMQNFMWGCAMVFEPQYGKVRDAAVKQASLIAMVDDVYDVYGSLEELEIFTDIVDRWDITGIDKLPRNISMILLTMFNTANQIGYDLLRDRGFNGIPHIAQAWATLCKKYLKEAKWYHSGYKPTLEEYLENGLVSISFVLSLVTAYLQTETLENLTYESAAYVNSVPPLVRYSGLLNRLYNDLGTSSAEIARGDTLKSIQCYMTQTGATEEAAREHIKGLVHEAWKGMNKCLFEQTPFAEPFVGFNVNTVRGSQFFYQHGDGYAVTESWTKDLSLSVLIHPIPLNEED
uniref:(-)-beta-bisabolene synthase n=1 Tax=Santalum album TaxID=35974 RepID=E3W326_SANAL|nr:(-)-beta-bisabolene synthase [Santalum album]